MSEYEPRDRYLLDVRRWGNRGILLIYYDTKDDTIKKMWVDDFHPQFYTNYPFGTSIYPDFYDVYRIQDGAFETAYGNLSYVVERKFDVYKKEWLELYKCNCERSWDVPKIAEMHVDAFENDIPYEAVFQYYKNISLISQEKDILKIVKDIMFLLDKLNVVAFDIETNIKTGRITAISVKSKKGRLVLYGTEEDILKRFYYILRKTHILFGWYSSIFDVPYILNRCEYYKHDDIITALRDSFIKRKVKHGETEWAFDLKNGIHVDFFFSIKRKIITKKNFADYKLDTVVRELFGFEHYLKDNQGRLDDLDENTFLEYCELDADATFEFSKYLPFLMLVSAVSGLSMTRIGLSGMSAIGDGFYIKRLREVYGNIIIPNVKNNSESGVKGAVVFEPIGGVHKDVTCADFKTQYGNIVVQNNISPENLNCYHTDCPVFTIENKQTKEMKKRGEHTYTKIKMCTKKKGVMVEVVEYTLEIAEILKKERNKYKGIDELFKLWNDFYDAWKAIRNVIAYGYNLSPASRFGHPTCGKLIVGVAAIKTGDSGNEVVKYFNERGDDGTQFLIYGDTDSVFVKELSDELIERIELVSGLEMDLEGTGTMIIRSKTKKKYILITHDGKSKIRGIRLRRKDTPVFVSKFQRYAVKRMEKAKDYDDLLRIHKSLLKDAKFVIKILRWLPYSDFIISKASYTSANNPQNTAKRQLEFSDVDFDEHDKIKYVYIYGWLQLKTKKKRVNTVRAYSLLNPEKDEIAYTKYEEMFVKSLSDLFAKKFRLRKSGSYVAKRTDEVDTEKHTEVKIKRK